MSGRAAVANAGPLSPEEMMLDEIAGPVATLREKILDIWGRL
jgi:hypothetical protein